MKKLLCLILCACMLSAFLPFAAASEEYPTELEIYKGLIALKTKYPEGMKWSLANSYGWDAGLYYPSRGCLGFGMMISDDVFGKDLPARQIKNNGSNISVYTLKAGDLLRLPGDAHTVVVLERHPDHIVVVEGNYQGKVHWGRKISAYNVSRSVHYTTRYPENYPEEEPKQAPTPVMTELLCGDETLSFSDIDGHWALDAIKFCVENKYITGIASGDVFAFAPSATATRGQLVTILWRMAGSPSVSETHGFADTPQEWYQAPISWAVREKIANGTSEKEFSPSGEVTREAVLTMMYRMAKSSFKEVSSLSAFADKDDVSPYARDAFAWALFEGIISKDSERLNPKAAVTRAEIATMIYNYMK